jgi:RNA polymerase sigma factor (TIGR02999 family)
MSTDQPNTTQLLVRVREGDQAALNDLFGHVYEALREIAHQRLSRYRPGETLQTTALVHEAYLKLVDQTQVELQDRAHFLALSSRVMRTVLIDYARARSAGKRGGGVPALPLDAVQVAADDRAADLLALDEALDRLAAYDERLSQIVEYRFFGGLTFDEIAVASGRSVPTAKRDWKRARIWLHRVMVT